MTGDLNYDAAGATRPASPAWTERPRGFRWFEATTRLGHGPVVWEAASSAVLDWGVKTRSGFTVRATDGLRVREGADYELYAALGPWSLHEPVRVVSVVEQPTRVGFAYGTRVGHPVAGEEAFVVHRAANGSVYLTLRSLTRAPSGPWRLAFPAVLVAQRVYRRRYRRALVGLDHPVGA